MIETHTSFVATAFTWAHEIGHALGMHHDFRKYDAKTKSFTSRTDDAGNTCTNVLGVMDYSDKQAQHWTACSKKDFNAFFKHQMNRFGSFCLEQ